MAHVMLSVAKHLSRPAERPFASLLRNIAHVTLSASEASRWSWGSMPGPFASLRVTGDEVSPRHHWPTGHLGLRVT